MIDDAELVTLSWISVIVVIILTFTLLLWPYPEWRQSHEEHYVITQIDDGEYFWGYKNVFGYVDYNVWSKYDSEEDARNGIKRHLKHNKFYLKRHKK